MDRQTPLDADRILEEIRAAARDKLEHEGEIDAGMRLVEDLGLDSMRLLVLAMEVEDRFRIRLDEADETAIATVGDLIAVVESKLAA